MQAEKQSERERALRAGWNQEAQDLDAVLRLIGLSPEHCRTEGGWLNLHRVRAALSHHSTPQGWQPIETCPHDGEVVDFWIPDGGTARARADDYWAGAHWLKAASHWSRLLSPPEQGGKG